jgi:hypothetical protein
MKPFEGPSELMSWLYNNVRGDVCYLSSDYNESTTTVFWHELLGYRGQDPGTASWHGVVSHQIRNLLVPNNMRELFHLQPIAKHGKPVIH